MKISKIRGSLYKSSRILGDVEAVEEGRVGKRVERRLLGRITGRLLRRVAR